MHYDDFGEMAFTPFFRPGFMLITELWLENKCESLPQLLANEDSNRYIMQQTKQNEPKITSDCTRPYVNSPPNNISEESNYVPMMGP